MIPKDTLRRVRESRLVVHIGLQRAASTFLQDQVFPSLAAINYVGKSNGDYPKWLIDWHYLEEERFQEAKDRVISDLAERLDPNATNLLSSEGFALFGGLAGQQARRLAAIAPAASVILVLRDPIDRLLSFYKYIVEHDGLFLSLADSVDWHDPPFVFYKRRPIYLRDYCYDDTIAAYRAVFGERLTILRFETLKTDPPAFWRALAAALAVPEEAVCRPWPQEPLNASLPAAAIAQRRFLNLRAAAAKLGGTVDADQPALAAASNEPVLSDTLRRRLEEYFRGRSAGYY